MLLFFLLIHKALSKGNSILSPELTKRGGVRMPLQKVFTNILELNFPLCLN